jgi:hypothetical protein
LWQPRYPLVCKGVIIWVSGHISACAILSTLTMRTESKIKNGMRYKGRDSVSKYKKMAYRNSAKKKSVSLRYKEWPKFVPQDHSITWLFWVRFNNDCRVPKCNCWKLLASVDVQFRSGDKRRKACCFSMEIEEKRRYNSVKSVYL